MQAIRYISVSCLAFCISAGQFPATSRFDAASVKPANPADTRGSTFEFTPGGGLNITNAALRAIIESAYDVRDFRIVGGPGWLDGDRFSISARSEEPSNIAETRVKLQALLAERFHLRAHREQREMQIYALVVSRAGSKLGEAAASSERSTAGIRATCGKMTGVSASMANLAVYLERQLRHPVFDRTVLSGRYNFQLDWASDSGPCAADSSDGPSLFTALQEQLGLKLDSTKGPVEVLIVDYAERPDRN